MAVKVHQAVMIPKEKLVEDPENSNKQNDQTFQELKLNIQEEGFDENLLVWPIGDGTYKVVSGNHRFRAGKEEGIEEFPCVVRDDWDQVKATYQGVRRNYARGKIDKDAFTQQVNSILSLDEDVDLDDIRAGMGFEDAEAFAQMYKEERDQLESAQADEIAEGAAQVKMIDDLGVVLSEIFSQYGDTVPQSFIVFPAGNKAHLYVACTPALKQTIEGIVEKCVLESLDINVALGGLLQIGMAHSNFMRTASPAMDEGKPDNPADLDLLQDTLHEEEET